MSGGSIRVCGTGDLEPGTHMQVRVPGVGALAVYHVEGKFYVTADSCTHMQASLGEEGSLQGHVIQCTWHDGKFDIRTGAPCALPCTEALRTFPVTIEGSDVFIEVA